MKNCTGLRFERKRGAGGAYRYLSMMLFRCTHWKGFDT